MLFTADVGRYDAPILRDPFPIPGPVDYFITESTYGTVSHGPIADVEPQLLDAVQYCVDHKSRLLVPSFAVGRTQTMLWYMEKFIQEGKIPAIPIFVDSPMGVEASKVTSQFRDNYDDQTNAMIGKQDIFGLARITFAATADQSKQINRPAGPDGRSSRPARPASSAGSCTTWSGASSSRTTSIVFVGWTPPNTLGRKLQDGQRRVQIYNRWYDLKCQVRTIHGLSAHADGDELLRFLKPTLVPQATGFVVHGEVPQAEGFAQRLLQAGVGAASVPAMETSVIAFAASGESVAAREPGKTDQD